MQPFGCMTSVFRCINHLEDFFLVPKCCHVKRSHVSDSKHSRRLAASLWAFLFLFFSGRSQCLCCEMFNFTESDTRGFLLQKNTSLKEVELCTSQGGRRRPKVRGESWKSRVLVHSVVANNKLLIIHGAVLDVLTGIRVQF